MSRLLLLGAGGMLGHRLAAHLKSRHEVTATVRDGKRTCLLDGRGLRLHTGVDLADAGHLRRLFRDASFDVVVNAAGVIKQRSADAQAAIAINSLLPHRLAAHCAESGARLLHFSTDCVFSGAADARRGARGYRESDPPDPPDLYGRSKLLGEVEGEHCLCLRTSLIGPELRHHAGLYAWYASSRGTVSGYRNARFSGITTLEAARLVDFLVRTQPELSGTWHVAATPISKYALLRLLQQRLPEAATVTPDTRVHCDRRLDGSRFRRRTGWKAPHWKQMVDDMVATS